MGRSSLWKKAEPILLLFFFIMVKGGAWRRLFQHHSAVTLPSILFSVVTTQAVIPYTVFSTQLPQQASDWNNGLLTGTLISSFLVGRAFGSPVLRLLATCCDKRAILQISLLMEAILTLVFGLSERITTMIVVRFSIGFFYPGNAFSKDLMQELSSSPEEIPVLATISVFIHSCCHAAGFFLGTLATHTWNLPYLQICLITAVILLFCFVAGFIDDPKSEDKNEVARNIVKIPNLHFEEFVEERGEKVDRLSQSQDEVPSYLEQFAEASSPDLSQLTVLKNIFQPEPSAHPQLSDFAQETTFQSDNVSSPEGFVKRTHISFVEQDLSFRKPAPLTSSLPPAPHRSGYASSFFPSLIVYSLLVLACTTSEYSALGWVVSKGYVSDVRWLGFVLGSSSGLSAFLTPVLMKRLSESVSMNRIGVWGMVVGGCGAALLPVVVELGQWDWGVCGLIGALVARECGARLAFSVLVMRLSDSASFSVRGSALHLADFTSTVAKAVGIAAGPALPILSFLASSHPVLIFTALSAGIWLVAAGVMEVGGAQYPRLSQAPFRW